MTRVTATASAFCDHIADVVNDESIISYTANSKSSGLSGLEGASTALGFALDSSFFVFSTVVGIAACCLGALALTLRAPLRLVVNVEGNSMSEEFSIDLIPGRVQPEEIKSKIDEVIANGGLPPA